MFFLKNDKKNESIFNGWNFEIVFDDLKFNISQKISELVDKDYILEIDESFDLKSLIKENFPVNKKYYLEITNNFNKYWDTLTINEFTYFKIFLGEITNHPKLEIVYFINADLSECFFKLFNDQIKDLLKAKLNKYSFIKLNIEVICSSKIKKEKIKKLISNLKLEDYLNFQISFSKDFNKEYKGINKAWELAKEDPEKYILYFHGKGLSYLKNKYFYIRQPLEKLIFNLLIKDWLKNLEKLNRLISINKLGILSGGNGWLWFNFWIAKSSYLSKIEKPRMTKRAFYYEDWIARFRIIKKEDFKNKRIYTNEFEEKYIYTLDQTMSILDNPKKLKYNIGSACKVQKGGFVGLGITKYTYRLWYLFYVILNRLGLNKGDKERFKFY